MVAKSQGSPSPKKTLTLFEPVTFPIALSALGLSSAAVLLANVSGSDVPKRLIIKSYQEQQKRWQ
jgi:hypothetical protein